MWRVRICAVTLLGVLLIGGSALGAPANQIAISVPAHIRRKSVYDVTIRGFSRRHAVAYLFIDYTGCARSFAAEHRRAPSESDFYGVRGRFAEVSGWKSSSKGLDHACAYLVGTKSGTLLAKARLSFKVH